MEIIFQSTPSLRKVTTVTKIAPFMSTISIHTFLTEGDVKPDWFGKDIRYFNPHLPYGR